MERAATFLGNDTFFITVLSALFVVFVLIRAVIPEGCNRESHPYGCLSFVVNQKMSFPRNVVGNLPLIFI